MGLPLKRDSRYNQGYYKPIYPQKYVGREVPIFRSGIELKFFKFCDNNPNVIKWSSEDIKIPYWDIVTRKNRTYYVDNFVEIKEGNIIKQYLVELKDKRETVPPNPNSKKKKSTLLYEEFQWRTNNSKWKYAQQFCKDHKLEFLLLAYSNKEGFQSVKLDFI